MDLIYIALCIFSFLFLAWIALALFGQSLRECDEERIADLMRVHERNSKQLKDRTAQA